MKQEGNFNPEHRFQMRKAITIGILSRTDVTPETTDDDIAKLYRLGEHIFALTATVAEDTAS